MKNVDHRKKIYTMFEKLIGRPMTKEEHTELKDAMLEYVHDATGATDLLNRNLEAALTRMRAEVKKKK